eukprot:4952022-Amphidinium_carterae.1
MEVAHKVCSAFAIGVLSASWATPERAGFCECKEQSSQALGILQSQLERCGPENLGPSRGSEKCWVSGFLFGSLLILFGAIVGIGCGWRLRGRRTVDSDISSPRPEFRNSSPLPESLEGQLSIEEQAVNQVSTIRRRHGL